tara:strand:+ start:147 stop:314 length:168 start_codon:yes stop_codon:yes gene_type:complete
MNTIPKVIMKPRKITNRSLKYDESLPFLFAFIKVIIKNAMAIRDAVRINNCIIIL